MSPRLAFLQAVPMTAVLLALSSALDTAVSQTRQVPDTYTATTTNMTPAGVRLKIDVLEWSDEPARAEVISALTGEAEEATSVAELPTIGYVWLSGSAVGYSLKYAHRTTTSDGQRVTLVTDKPVGSYGFRPWVADGDSTASAVDYSVIELYLDGEGHGVGTMSLAADVVFDSNARTISLARGGTAHNVLAEAMLEAKPYWAQGGG